MFVTSKYQIIIIDKNLTWNLRLNGCTLSYLNILVFCGETFQHSTKCNLHLDNDNFLLKISFPHKNPQCLMPALVG